MKKILLLFVLAGFFANAQHLEKSPIVIGGGPDAVISIQNLNAPVMDVVPTSSVLRIPKEAPAYKLSRSMDYNRVLIGKSQYGLQTNAAVPRRSILYPDGKLSTVFTTASDITPFNSRGSGYNYYNGTSWFGVIEDRIEKFRSGWPNIVVYDDGTKKVEYVVSHYAEASGGSGGYSINVNDGIGSTNWSETSKNKGTGPIWPRVAQSGDFIYIIGAYSDTNVYKNNIRTPMVFSRYNIKTDTWEDDDIVLPGYEEKYFKYGSADNYSIHARDNVVAIVVAQRSSHVAMWKSLDYGDTWERTFIDEFELPVPEFLGDTNYFYYNDGAPHVIIDEDKVCHVFYGATVGFTFDPDEEEGRYWYRGTSHAMLYFNDISEMDSVMKYDTFYKDSTVYRLYVDGNMASSVHFMFDTTYTYAFNTLDSTVSQTPKASMELTLYNDINNPFTAEKMTVWPTYYMITEWDSSTGIPVDSIFVPADSVIFLDSFVVEVIDKIIGTWETFKVYPNMGSIPTAKIEDRNENGYTDISRPTWDSELSADQGGRYGNTALLTMPSAAIDNNGNIYVVYSAPVEDAYSPVGKWDTTQYIGENFRDIYVIYSQDGGQSWSVPQNLTKNTMMEDVFAHIAFDVDDNLHIVYQEDEEPGTDVQNNDPPTINYIFYIAVPVADVLANTIGGDPGLSIDENPFKNASFKNVYPNPFSDEAVLEVNLSNKTDIYLQIIDLMGKNVYSNQFNNLNSGTHFLQINANNLKAGAYILKAQAGNDVFTTKLIVE